MVELFIKDCSNVHNYFKYVNTCFDNVCYICYVNVSDKNKNLIKINLDSILRLLMVLFFCIEDHNCAIFCQKLSL